MPAVYVIGSIVEKWGARTVFAVTAMVLGNMIIYLFGVFWLQLLTGMTFSKTLLVGMLPFIPGDMVKIAAAVPIARALRPLINPNRS
jgi:biotin transport system substrate-specific component